MIPLEKKVSDDDKKDCSVEDFLLFRDCVKRDPLPNEAVTIDEFREAYMKKRDDFNLESYGMRTAFENSCESVPAPKVTLRELYTAYSESLERSHVRIKDKSVLSDSERSNLEELCSRKTEAIRKFDFEEQMIALGYEKVKNCYSKEEDDMISYVFPEGISDLKNCNRRFGLDGSFYFSIEKKDEKKFIKTVEKVDDTTVATTIVAIVGLAFSFVPALIFDVKSEESLGFALSVGSSFGLGSYIGHAIGKHIARNATERINLIYMQDAAHSAISYDCSIIAKRLE